MYLKKFNEFNNYEVERRIAQKNLNEPPRNNLKLGMMDLDNMISKFRLKKQQTMPNPKPVLENDLLGKDIKADVPNHKTFHSHPNMKVMNKETNLYSFDTHQRHSTIKSNKSYGNISSNFFGIPSRTIKMQTDEGKMAGIYGKTNQEMLTDNWRKEMNSDPRFAALLSGSKETSTGSGTATAGVQAELNDESKDESKEAWNSSKSKEAWNSSKPKVQPVSTLTNTQDESNDDDDDERESMHNALITMIGLEPSEQTEEMKREIFHELTTYSGVIELADIQKDLLKYVYDESYEDKYVQDIKKYFKDAKIQGTKPDEIRTELLEYFRNEVPRIDDKVKDVIKGHITKHHQEQNEDEIDDEEEVEQVDEVIHQGKEKALERLEILANKDKKKIVEVRSLLKHSIVFFDLAGEQKKLIDSIVDTRGDENTKLSDDLLQRYKTEFGISFGGKSKKTVINNLVKHFDNRIKSMKSKAVVDPDEIPENLKEYKGPPIAAGKDPTNIGKK